MDRKVPEEEEKKNPTKKKSPTGETTSGICSLVAYAQAQPF